MKRVFLVLVLGVLLVGVVFVSGVFTEEDNLDGSVVLNEGWNLVSIYAIEDIFDYNLRGNYYDYLKGLGVEAAFYYDRYNSQYIRVYPNPEEEKFEDFVSRMGDPESGGDIMEYGAFVNSAIWIYTSKSTTSNFRTLDGPVYMKNAHVSKGWNFLTITPEMVGQTLNEMKGNCDWEKIYAWGKEAGESQWLDLLNNPNFVDKEKFTQGMLWTNLVIKVSSDCNMGSSGTSGGTTPPVLPGGAQGASFLPTPPARHLPQQDDQQDQPSADPSPQQQCE